MYSGTKLVLCVDVNRSKTLQHSYHLAINVLLCVSVKLKVARNIQTVISIMHTHASATEAVATKFLFATFSVCSSSQITGAFFPSFFFFLSSPLQASVELPVPKLDTTPLGVSPQFTPAPTSSAASSQHKTRVSGVYCNCTCAYNTTHQPVINSSPW